MHADGTIYLNKKQFASASDMLQELINLRTVDQDLNVIVRGDSHTQYKDIRTVLDVCQQAAVPKVDLATEAAGKAQLIPCNCPWFRSHSSAGKKIHRR